MCGIVGIASHAPVAAELYESLIHLQHRGQDAAGIVTDDKHFYVKRGSGLVREIFTPKNIQPLQGDIGVAHTRYGTSGGYTSAEIQPLEVAYPFRIAFAHNGNLVNYAELSQQLKEKHIGHWDISVDSALLLHLFAEGLKDVTPDQDDAQFFKALTETIRMLHRMVQGSYSVVAMIEKRGLLAFRDPFGIRPLVLGERQVNGHHDYIFASENTAFYPLGFETKGDLAAGEVVYISESRQCYREVVTPKTLTPCAFEYVYFARPDATLDEVSVYRARLRMGQNLAKAWLKQFPGVLPDVVIPAPYTANTAALSFAHEIGVRYSEGLYKNTFIGRTFIMPNQSVRERSVRHKLTPQRLEIENKKVLVVDDSIVRGTTSREMVKMIREAGATEISLVSTCPPLRFPCFYGVDIPSRKELIAAQHSLEAIQQFLGVDHLLYQTKDDLVEAITRHGPHFKRPCMACMDGCYVSGEVTQEKMALLEQAREK
jgi:amidophosphoribosyltransferase